MARHCAKMSRAIRLQVGSVIVKNNNIISFSWNGTPVGWDNSCEYKEYESTNDLNKNSSYQNDEGYPLQDENGRYRLKTRPEVLHAERNAIDKLAKGNEGGSGATMFVTHAPCLECAKSIYGAGIKELYYETDYRLKEGVYFLEKCGVKIKKITDK